VSIEHKAIRTKRREGEKERKEKKISTTARDGGR
jgi:hypothetical protein